MFFWLVLSLHQQADATVSGEPNPPQIEWMVADFPPVTIPSGPDKGTGFFDRVTSLLSVHLPQYKHLNRVANYQRIINEIKHGENVCCPALYKTEEREKFIAFSMPAMIVLPNSVIIRTTDKHKFTPYLNQEGEVNLGKLLENEQLLLGVSNGRKYSGGIDAVLSRHLGDKHVLVRSGQDVFQGLFSMLQNGRVDFILGYPAEAGYAASRISVVEDIQAIPIAENKIAYTLGYVGCSKTEKGEEIIRAVNAVLREKRESAEYIGYYDSWLDVSTRDKYRKMVGDYYASSPREGSGKVPAK